MRHVNYIIWLNPNFQCGRSLKENLFLLQNDAVLGLVGEKEKNTQKDIVVQWRVHLLQPSLIENLKPHNQILGLHVPVSFHMLEAYITMPFAALFG